MIIDGCNFRIKNLARFVKELNALQKLHANATGNSSNEVKMLKVLIVEDDLIIADMVEDRLIREGFCVCGIATNNAEATVLAMAYTPDCAIVDVRLADGDLGTDLAVILKGLQQVIGILYATGNLELVMMAREHDLPQQNIIGEACIMKPYSFSKLGLSLRIVAEIARLGQTTQPYPEGLFVFRRS
jgi:DNA-binding response OmpR family regulator